MYIVTGCGVSTGLLIKRILLKNLIIIIILKFVVLIIDEHFKRNIYLPFLDSLLQQFSLRFGDLAKQAIRGLSLIPSNVSNIDALTADGILHYYHDDLPSPDSFHQELKLWQQMWRNADSTQSTLSDTLADSRSCRIMYQCLI